MSLPTLFKKYCLQLMCNTNVMSIQFLYYTFSWFSCVTNGKNLVGES